MPTSVDRPVIIGLTGGFGTGKTTVGCMLHKLGARLLDADALAHRLMRKDTTLYKRIVSRFGKDILGKKGEIDRALLARRVFSKKRLLSELCSISHPVIISEMRQMLRKVRARGAGRFVVIDAPLLIEAGLLDIVDILIVVAADRKRQIGRLARRTRLPEAEILKRIRSQLPLRDKMRLADYIVNNNGSLNETKREVKMIWEEIKRRQV